MSGAGCFFCSGDPLANVALVVRRVVTCEGIERQIGDVIELSPVRAVMAMTRHGHALAFAREQPKSHTKPKRTRRKKVAEPVEA